MDLVLNVEYQLKLKTQRNPYKPQRTFSFRINALKRVFHIEFLECVRADGRKKEGNERFLKAGTSFNRL